MNGIDPLGLQEPSAGSPAVNLLVWFGEGMVDTAVGLKAFVTAAASLDYEGMSENKQHLLFAALWGLGRPACGAAKFGGTIATREGLINISQHLAQFAPDAANDLMYTRIAGAFERRAALTGVDAAFYQHELIESGLMEAGMEARAAHLQTLSIQGITYQKGYESLLYSPGAIKLFNPGY